MLIQHPGPSGSEHRPQCFLHVALGELSRERLGRPPAHPEEPGGQLVGHGTFGGFGREHRGRLFEVVGVLHSRTRSRPPPPPPAQAPLGHVVGTQRRGRPLRPPSALLPGGPGTWRSGLDGRHTGSVPLWRVCQTHCPLGWAHGAMPSAIQAPPGAQSDPGAGPSLGLCLALKQTPAERGPPG